MRWIKASLVKSGYSGIFLNLLPQIVKRRHWKTCQDSFLFFFVLLIFWFFLFWLENGNDGDGRKLLGMQHRSNVEGIKPWNGKLLSHFVTFSKTSLNHFVAKMPKKKQTLRKTYNLAKIFAIAGKDCTHSCLGLESLWDEALPV